MSGVYTPRGLLTSDKKAKKRERDRLYRLANLEAIKARMVTWKLSNPDYYTEYRLSHPEKYTQQDQRRMQIQYDITPEQYEGMLAIQGGVCAICKHPPKNRRLDVDHDHQTKRVRGLLCHVCNRMRVGPSKDSDVVLYERIVEYLRSTFDARGL
jgi:hypothetical protein